MDLSNVFVPLAIGVASLFAATLFVVTVITHEPRDRNTKPPQKR
jgi:hypothetical protein